MSGHSFHNVQRCHLQLNTPVQWLDGDLSISFPFETNMSDFDLFVGRLLQHHFGPHGESGQFEYASCQFSSDIKPVTVLPSSASSASTKQSNNSEDLLLSISGHSLHDVQRCHLQLNTPVQWLDGDFSISFPFETNMSDFDIFCRVTPTSSLWICGTGIKHFMGVIIRVWHFRHGCLVVTLCSIKFQL